MYCGLMAWQPQSQLQYIEHLSNSVMYVVKGGTDTQHYFIYYCAATTTVNKL